MRKFYTLLVREVRSYFHSPIAYVVLVFFLLVSGVDFYFQVSFMNQRPASYSVQEAFFNSVFFWFAFVLIFPLITMRLFAEEFKLGTIEPLMTAPVRDWQVILAKFFGALVFYVILWLPTLLYFWVFQAITHQPAANSIGAYLGAYLMLLLLGMFYLSVGCLASVLTKNQIVAAIISFCLITLHFFSGLISFVLLEVNSSTRQLLGYFFALSDKTKRFLRSMPGKARITVFFMTNNAIASDVQGMLTEYQYAAKGKLDVENIDPDRNLSRAKALLDKYKVVTGEDLLILDYDGRNKTVKASEMAEVDQGNPMFGEPSKVTAFKGEQAVTSALMELVEGKKNTIGYVLGHKEPPIAEPPPTSTPTEATASPIGVLKTFIENENIKLQELNLFEVGAVPSELKAILIDGPQYDFSDREMKLLRDFWGKQGRILLLLDPGAKTPKLNAFLNEVGVKANDDRLMAMVKTGIEEVGLFRDVYARFLGDSPITRRLAEAR